MPRGHVGSVNIQIESERYFVTIDGERVAEVTRELKPRMVADCNNALMVVEDAARRLPINSREIDEFVSIIRGQRLNPGM